MQKSSDPDPYTIEDPARIASELRNRSARPENRPGRAGFKKFSLSPARPAFGPARMTSLADIM